MSVGGGGLFLPLYRGQTAGRYTSATVSPSSPFPSYGAGTASIQWGAVRARQLEAVSLLLLLLTLPLPLLPPLSCGIGPYWLEIAPMLQPRSREAGGSSSTGSASICLAPVHLHAAWPQHRHRQSPY